MSTNSIFVSSEINPLKRVIVHKPDSGIGRISPKRSHELLFDDIVDLKQMQEEHEVFRKVLSAFLGKENVLEVEQLLEEAIEASQTLTTELIEKVVTFEEVPSRYKDILTELDARTLAQTLISGYYAKDNIYMFDPIPNFIFTRDIAVTVNDHIIITKAAKLARQRENIITRFIVHTHPIFKALKDNNRIINLNMIDEFPPSPLGEQVSAEGGDIMVINKDFILIGCSERTTNHAFESLKQTLFERNAIQNVVQVTIPNDRSFMHIDTIFTMIDEGEMVCYKPIVYDGLASWVDVHTASGSVRSYASIKDFFEAEINGKMEYIFSGKGIAPYQEREQWTDGCNLVAIKPGVAITYDRNHMTIEALQEKGYKILKAKDLIKQVKTKKLDPASIEKTIITLDSNELSRARGGSHCMTCPIERAI